MPLSPASPDGLSGTVHRPPSPGRGGAPPGWGAIDAVSLRSTEVSHADGLLHQAGSGIEPNRRRLTGAR